jgi:hypothetical protein
LSLEGQGAEYKYLPPHPPFLYLAHQHPPCTQEPEIATLLATSRTTLTYALSLKMASSQNREYDKFNDSVNLSKCTTALTNLVSGKVVKNLMQSLTQTKDPKLTCLT